MVSNASEDLPEPLTPVTTVMALCGISRVMFFRLWTRAPRTRKVSCSGVEWSPAVVICFVAKAKPRQQVSDALPKPQIIRRGCGASKHRVCDAIFVSRTLLTWLRLLAKHDLADSARNPQVNRGRRLFVSFI